MASPSQVLMMPSPSASRTSLLLRPTILAAAAAARGQPGGGGRGGCGPGRLPLRTDGSPGTDWGGREDHPFERTRHHAGDRRADDPGDAAVRLVVSSFEQTCAIPSGLHLFRPHRACDLVDPDIGRPVPGGPDL